MARVIECLGPWEDSFDFCVRPGNYVDGEEFADPPRSGRAGIGRRLYGADIPPHEHGDVAGADVFLPDKDDVGGFHHRIRRLDGSDEAFGLDHPERICCHCVLGRTVGPPARL